MGAREKAAVERRLVLAGNPNVGKSTVFNGLTGLHQHTGNWPGKTVANAQGAFSAAGVRYRLTDVPGAYSLTAHSPEEEVAREGICFEEADGIVVVCDATCLERNLVLVLQILELGRPVLVCVNLMDEARRRGITPRLEALSDRLGVPVCGAQARQRGGLQALLRGLPALRRPPERPVEYPAAVEQAVEMLCPLLEPLVGARMAPRFAALRLLEGEPGWRQALAAFFGRDVAAEPAVAAPLQKAQEALEATGLAGAAFGDCVTDALVHRAQGLAAEAVPAAPDADRRDWCIDGVVTGRLVGYPLMLLLLLAVLWITLQGANAPSEWLSARFLQLQELLSALFAHWNAPEWLHGALVLGAYRVLAFVTAVMLPPMAIFFPLFTLLEDVGYLPRIAYNLDRPFQRCHACGKQALTMCMGFGCNAVGVVGCRIVDSPRERLLAILTNSLVPCNGRFPALVALLSLFFVGDGGDGGFLAATLLTGLLVLAVVVSMGVTRLLSATLLRGLPSSFVLELPPYRRPQVGRVLVRSLLDRTLFVLGRAAAVAAPAGLVIWLLANVSVGELSCLQWLAAFFDPFARLLGLDGVILLAFVLSLPANEIVMPIMLMAYLSEGILLPVEGMATLREVLVAQGWTGWTAAGVLLLCLFHWPCSTTLLTVHRETGSWKWTALAAAIPTAVGFSACFLLECVHRLLGG